MEFRFKLKTLVALLLNSIALGIAITVLLSSFSGEKTHSEPKFYLLFFGIAFFSIMIIILRSRVRIIPKK